MKKRALGMVFKRFGALAGAFAIAVSFTSYGGDRTPVPYSQRVYEHYDPAAMEEILEAFEAACQKEGQEEEVERLYDLLIKEYNWISTLMYMAQLTYDSDISDLAAGEAQAYCTELYIEMSAKAMAAVQKGLNSAYGPLISDKIGINIAGGYEPSAEEEELIKEEEELIRRYEVLAAADTNAVVGGESWTYDRLETETAITSESYSEIQEALSKERNRILGTCLLELADVRRRIAGLCGYSSYSEYVYEARYGRDYTLEDASRLSEAVKREIVPLYDDLWYADIDFSTYDELDKLENRPVEEMLDAVQAGVSMVNRQLGDRFRYMRENELYDIQGEEPGKDRVESSYTVRLASYGDGYIFINREHTFRDYQAIVHEFGHFAAFCNTQEPELYSTFAVDVMEIQSMGLELLVSNYAQEVAGEAAEAYAYETVTDMFYNIINACMFNELEEMLYGNPDVQLDDLNRRFQEIQNEYGSWYYRQYGDMCYDWVEVSHIFYNPMYYMGYGTASFSALDLWLLSQKDMEGAVNTYMGILNEGQKASYRETLKQWGMRDFFMEDEVSRLAAEIRTHYDLEAWEDYDHEGLWEEDTQGGIQTGQANQKIMLLLWIALGGIGAVFVLQLALLAVGGIIIWLLVKKN